MSQSQCEACVVSSHVTQEPGASHPSPAGKFANLTLDHKTQYYLTLDHKTQD